MRVKTAYVIVTRNCYAIVSVISIAYISKVIIESGITSEELGYLLTGGRVCDLYQIEISQRHDTLRYWNYQEDSRSRQGQPSCRATHGCLPRCRWSNPCRLEGTRIWLIVRLTLLVSFRTIPEVGKSREVIHLEWRYSRLCESPGIYLLAGRTTADGKINLPWKKLRYRALN